MNTLSTRIVDLPESERPRERLARLGPGSLSNQELLAILLRTGGQGGHAVGLAEQLLSHYGSVNALATADFVEILDCKYIGPAKASALVAAFELGRRHANGAPSSEFIRGPEDIMRCVRPLLDDKQQEEVAVVVLTPGNRLKRVVQLTRGGPDRCLLIVRDLIGMVMRNGGTAFAVAHNHPSGDCSPSAEDLAVTLRIEQAARTVRLDFLDHLVVSGANWKSAKSH